MSKNDPWHCITRTGMSAWLASAFIALMPGQVSANSVTLAWNPIASPTDVGYVVHYGPASGNYPNQFYAGSGTNATITGLIGCSTNYFVVTAMSTSGLESAPSVEVSYVVPPTINLVTNGIGAITPDISKQKLILGKQYLLSAIPASGQVFAGWSGDITTPLTKTAVKLTANLVVQANFIPNPFLPIQGKYNGLFCEADAVRQSSAGFVTMTVTANGDYSGRLQLGATYYPFSGKLSLQGRATNTLPRLGSNALILELQVGMGGQADQLFGRVSDGTWISTIAGDRYVYNAITNSPPWVGHYTTIIPGNYIYDPTLPMGDGYGSVVVDAGGTIHFTATLADGVRITQNIPVSKNGQWPLYVSLYSGKGSIMAWLAFTNQSTTDLAGQLSWIKPAQLSAIYYPTGFTNVTTVLGSTYVRPVSATNCVLNLTNASIAFLGGNLAADFTNSVVLASNNKVTNLSSNQLLLSFTLSTGIFNGKAKDVSNGVMWPFHGAVLQKMNLAQGAIFGTNQTGRVLLTQ